MITTRANVIALAIVVVFCAAPGDSTGQEKIKPPVRTPQQGEVAALKSAGVIPKADLAKAKASFEGFAKFYAEYLNYLPTYTAPQEFRPEPPPPYSPYTVDQLINEVNRNLLVPSPVPVPNPVANQPGFALVTSDREADYVRELGAALDKALGEVVRNANERVVRVNAARMLAAACRSGAHAHYPTITDLIADAKTDPEVRYYALQGATNLLAAYDLNDYQSRKHSNDPQEVGKLIEAVQAAALKPDLLVPPVELSVGKEARKVVAPDQVPVVRFIRRQAVKALAQVRFAEYEVAKGKVLYPSHTLALVALGRVPIETYQTTTDKDGTEKADVVVAPKSAQGLAEAADAAEAVIGIMNMAPPKGGAAAKKYAAPMADVVATGVATWATPRAAAPADKSLPWKGTAARMEDALKTWQGVFDVNFNPARPVIRPELVPPAVSGVAKAITDNVLDPINNPTTRTVSVTGLLDFQRNTLRNNKDLTPRPFVAPDSPALPSH